MIPQTKRVERLEATVSRPQDQSVVVFYQHAGEPYPVDDVAVAQAEGRHVLVVRFVKPGNVLDE